MAHKIKIESPTKSPEILMMGYICIKDVQTLPEKVGILDRFGLSDSDIATICNCAGDGHGPGHRDKGDVHKIINFCLYKDLFPCRDGRVLIPRALFLLLQSR